MKYENVLEQFNGSIWAITPQKMEEIVNFVNSLTVDGIESVRSAAIKISEGSDEPRYKIRGTTALVPVRGSIFHRANLLQSYSGGTSTSNLISDLREIASNDHITNVVLQIDSPGGAVGGLSEAAEVIRSMRDTKNVIAHVDGSMASAAYWIGSAADKIYLTRNSSVGSIGVYMAVPDYSEAYAQAGMRFRIFRSSPLKGAGNGMEPLSEEMVEDFQRGINEHYEEFLRNVSLNRNITMDQAKQMGDARMHAGENAVREGFADGVLTLDELLETLDEEAEVAEQLASVKDAYANTVNLLSSLMAERDSLLEELARTENALRDMEAEAFEEKVEAAVEELTTGTNAKVAPAKADSLRERLRADFKGTMAAMEMIDVGAAAPKEMDLAAPKETVEDDSLPVAYSQEQAKVFDDFGIEYRKSY